MNICGCLLHAVPSEAARVRSSLEGVPGVEVHAAAADGRFVVVVEDTAARRASETIMDLHQIPGVVSLTLTYHHFEEEQRARLAPEPTDHSPAGDQPHDRF